MRFFRIPGFTGIEAHRDDADRGSLRVVEGCLPHGTGGLRSGPVWKKIGSVDHFGDDEKNYVSASDDGKGNSIIFVSRNCTVNGAVMFSEENTDLESLGESYEVALPVDGLFSREDATISSIGNRLYAIGDGSQEAMYVGKGPVGSGAEVYPDETLYAQEWSRFPKCQFYARGPKATIFAAGNPDKPLTVYVSEPAGLTSSFKDSPYSTEDASDLYNAGKLSTVDILGSDASRITALSTRGDQVVVHTDKGAFLLYAPSSDQASTGYRVEQAPATNFSSAVNHKVVSGESGTQTLWLGHDGQIYKDEAASRGSAELKSNADQDQANWKSKGAWEHELPTDLSNSFSVFSGQTGDYMFFVESEESASYAFNDGLVPAVTNGQYAASPEVYFQATDSDCSMHSISENVQCCKMFSGVANPDEGKYSSCEECVANSSAVGCCCDNPVGAGLFNVPSHTVEELVSFGFTQEEAVELLNDNPAACCAIPINLGFNWSDCNGCSQSAGGQFSTFDDCISDWFANADCFWDYTCDSACQKTTGGNYLSKEKCETAKSKDRECDKQYNIVSCSCAEAVGPGDYTSLDDCILALSNDSEYESCWSYESVGCGCQKELSGSFDTKQECEKYTLENRPECVGYSIYGCDCLETLNGEYSQIERCQDKVKENPACKGYKLVGCNCVEDNSETPESTLQECEIRASLVSFCDTWDLVDCECKRNDTGTGAYPSEELCKEDSNISECNSYSIQNCECVESADGSYNGIYECTEALNNFAGCFRYTLTADCDCVVDANGKYESLHKCQQDQSECTNFDVIDCACEATKEGVWSNIDSCTSALETQQLYKDCWNFTKAPNACRCDRAVDGEFSDIATCEDYLLTLADCRGYDIAGCGCELSLNGAYYAKETCEAIAQAKDVCSDHSIVDCECVPDTSGNALYTTKGACEAALEDESLCSTYDLIEANLESGQYTCECKRNPDKEGAYITKEKCVEALNARSTCTRYSVTGCECTPDNEGWVSGLDNCEQARDELAECKKYEITADCTCEEADDGSIVGLTNCENQRLELCARFEINDCQCQESQEFGTIVGLSNCHADLSAEPYFTQCAGWTHKNCECVRDQEGEFESFEDCFLAIDENPECSNLPWQLPNPDTVPDGSAFGTECYCTQSANGTFSDRKSCQDYLLQLRGREALADCFGCETSYTGYGYPVCCCADCGEFAPLEPCSNCTASSGGGCIDYCSARGGQDTYCDEGNGGSACDKCGKNTCGPKRDEDILYLCDDSGFDADGLVPCSQCPDSKFVLEIDHFGGCHCEQKVVPPNTPNAYSTEQECELAKENTCKTYVPNDTCGCDENFDGTLNTENVFDTVEECQEYHRLNSPDCLWYSVNDSCDCVEDAENGVFLGLEQCQEAVNSNSIPDCELYYVNNDCECVLSEPEGNTEPPIRGLNACMLNIENGNVESCKRHTLDLATCNCVEDVFMELEGTSYVSLDACNEALETESLCLPHWIYEDACNCEPIDPEDGSSSHEGFAACMTALEAALPNCFCDSTELKYTKFIDDTDGSKFCFDVSPSTGDATECDCLDEGYTIQS